MPSCERVLCAAIVCDGRVWTGPSHAAVLTDIRAASEAGPKLNPHGPQGFFTSQLRFVGRVEARELAVRAGQVTKTINEKELFSEDLKHD